MRSRCFFPFFAITVISLPVVAADREIAEAIKTVNAIGRESANSVPAAKAARELSELPADALPEILAGFDSTNPLAENLLRSAVESIADRTAQSEASWPTNELAAFIDEPQKHDARARRLAYELLQRSDATRAQAILPTLLTDPSSELRRDAVAYWIGAAKRLLKENKSDEAKAAYEKALSGAVDDDQVKEIVKALKERGVDVDLHRHFGFLTSWQVIGPFDNREQKGFNAKYPPETSVDLAAKYEGQLGEVSWQPIDSKSPYGEIDIGKTLENWKGSAVYLFTTFESSTAQQVELRLGTPNSWKLWVNGEFVFGREEYHRGWSLDQYRVPVRLKEGRNTILIKLLQNEQTEDWAQDYKVQVRVADPSGQAVLPAGESGKRAS